MCAKGKKPRSKDRSKKSSLSFNKGAHNERRNIGLLIATAVIAVFCIISFTPLSSKINQGLDIQGGLSVILSASHSDGSQVTSDEMERAESIITSRVNKLGASEATVQKQGDTSILVQIPGVDDPEAALTTIGTTGALEFVDLHDIDDEEVVELIESGITGMSLEPGTYTAFMNGDSIKAVSVNRENTGTHYEVDLKLDSTGTQAFATVTKELVSTNGQIAIVLDGVVDSAPAVQAAITNGEVSITGKYTLEEAKSLQTVLESGALPVDLDFSESRVVGPTLGQDSLRAGLIAALVGMLLVAIYLVAFYRGMGTLTAVNLVVFAIFYLGILAALSHFGLFSLSLAGIAGMVLTIGMAADSSILVLERFKEEIRMGRSVKSASISGVRHAIGTSIDADLVTLVSALALFFIAIGSVKGFGLTLALGIICDIVTMLIFKAPIIRLLAPRCIEKNPAFWGISEDVAIGVAAEAAALEKGARNA